jgi:hypothetical protein
MNAIKMWIGHDSAWGCTHNWQEGTVPETGEAVVFGNADGDTIDLSADGQPGADAPAEATGSDPDPHQGQLPA